MDAKRQEAIRRWWRTTSPEARESAATLVSFLERDQPADWCGQQPRCHRCGLDKVLGSCAWPNRIERADLVRWVMGQGRQPELYLSEEARDA